MDEAKLEKIKTAYAAAKKKLASIRAKRARILTQDAIAANASRSDVIRARLRKL